MADVRAIALSANIPLVEGEIQQLQSALDQTASLVESFHKQTSFAEQLPPTHHTTALVNVWREDAVDSSNGLSIEAVFANGARRLDDFIVVPSVNSDTI